MTVWVKRKSGSLSITSAAADTQSRPSNICSAQLDVWQEEVKAGTQKNICCSSQLAAAPPDLPAECWTGIPSPTPHPDSPPRREKPRCPSLCLSSCGRQQGASTPERENSEKDGGADGQEVGLLPLPVNLLEASKERRRRRRSAADQGSLLVVKTLCSFGVAWYTLDGVLV